MKKALSLIIGLLILGSTITLAAKPVNAGQQNMQQENKQEKTQQNDQLNNGSGNIKKELRLKKQNKLESREERAEQRKVAREERFAKKYSKKTALMERYFEKKLMIFQENLSDKVLLKAYPIFINKLSTLVEKMENNENKLSTQRIEFLYSIIDLIQEEFNALQDEINN